MNEIFIVTFEKNLFGDFYYVELMSRKMLNRIFNKSHIHIVILII